MGYPPHAFSADAWKHVVLKDNRLYSHKILRVGYTAYDSLQREDTIHVGTDQCNIMLLDKAFNSEAKKVQHPYHYARVNGVYHTDVSFAGPLPAVDRAREYCRTDFIWVHWHEFLPSKEEFALDRVAPVPFHTGKALGFIDPCNILRGVHLIPHFSLAEPEVQVQVEDDILSNRAQWKAYYINRFDIFSTRLQHHLITVLPDLQIETYS